MHLALIRTRCKAVDLGRLSTLLNHPVRVRQGGLTLPRQSRCAVRVAALAAVLLLLRGRVEFAG